MIHGHVSCLTFRIWRKCVKANDSHRENFSNRAHQSTIKTEAKIYTRPEDGKIPFVSAADTAAVAFHALTDV